MQLKQDSHTRLPIDIGGLDNPQNFVPKQEIETLKKRMSDAIADIREKRSNLTINDLKRLLFRAASTLIFIEEVRFLYYRGYYVHFLIAAYSGTMTWRTTSSLFHSKRSHSPQSPRASSLGHGS